MFKIRKCIRFTEMKMLRYIHGIHQEEHKRNETRDIASVKPAEVLMRKRLEW